MSAKAKQQLAELDALLGNACDADATPVQMMLYALTTQPTARAAMGGIIADAADEVLTMADACRAAMNEEALAGSLGALHRRLSVAAKIAELLNEAGEP